MSIEKPKTEQELIDRIINDILHDFTIEALRKFQWMNFPAHHRWLQIPFDDLKDLYPDIRQGPEALQPQDTDTELEASVKDMDLREFLRDDAITPFDLSKYYGLDDAEVERQFHKHFRPFLDRLYEVIRDAFPDLRLRRKEEQD